MATSTSGSVHLHRLLCTEEELQFYALNMLHDLAHDYMKDIPLNERTIKEEKETCVTEVSVDQSSTNRYCQVNLKDDYKLIAKKQENPEKLSWAVIDNTTPLEGIQWSDTELKHKYIPKFTWRSRVNEIKNHMAKPPPAPPVPLNNKEEQNKLIIEIIQYFKDQILDDTALQSHDLLRNQDNLLNFIVENKNSKTTDYDTDMLCNVVDTMQENGVIKIIENKNVGSANSTLVEHINRRLNGRTCNYLIDNAKNDIHVHELGDYTFCPISSSMDGNASVGDKCEDFPNVSDLRDLSPPEKTEKGDMFIELYTKKDDEDNNHIFLKRIHKANNMDLTAEFKFGTFHFESTMSIISVKKKYSTEPRKKYVHDIQYTIKLNDGEVNFINTIKYSRDDVTDINLTSNNIYKKALKNIENQEGNNRLVIAYGTLIFKSFGDILQEWNGVLQNGGYHGVKTYSLGKDGNNEVCQYLDGKPVRVILSRDKLSGARILWSLFKGRTVWKKNINENCFGGYVNKPKDAGIDYKIYNPRNNNLYKNRDINKSDGVAQRRRFEASLNEHKRGKPEKDQAQGKEKEKSQKEKSVSPGKRGKPQGKEQDGFRRTKSPKTLNVADVSTNTGTDTNINIDTNTNTGRSKRKRKGRRTKVATGGASSIQQETYQDPLTYTIVAIGAFAAMMIGLQR